MACWLGQPRNLIWKIYWKIGYKLELPSKKLPPADTYWYGVPADLTVEEMKLSVVNQNFNSVNEGIKQGRLELVFKIGEKGRHVVNWVLEVTPAWRKLIIEKRYSSSSHPVEFWTSIRPADVTRAWNLVTWPVFAKTKIIQFVGITGKMRVLVKIHPRCAQILRGVWPAILDVTREKYRKPSLLILPKKIRRKLVHFRPSQIQISMPMSIFGRDQFTTRGNK